MNPSKLVWLGWLMASLGSFGFAQASYPKAELFAGYSYATLGHGWDLSLSRNFHKNFGVTADLAGHYGGLGFGVRSHEFLIGPRITGRTGRVTGFGHALFGLTHLRWSDRGFSWPEPFLSRQVEPVTLSETHFTAGLGGGIDIKLSDRVAFRVLRLDVLGLRTEVGWLHNIRLQTGVVLQFGSRAKKVVQQRAP